MPLYEYECAACHRRTEKIQKFSDPELTVCPHCGGALERTVTAPSFQFAGGGWYKDGYGSTPPPTAKDSASVDSSATATPAAPATTPAAPTASPAPAASVPAPVAASPASKP